MKTGHSEPTAIAPSIGITPEWETWEWPDELPTEEWQRRAKIVMAMEITTTSDLETALAQASLLWSYGKRGMPSSVRDAQTLLDKIKRSEANLLVRNGPSSLATVAETFRTIS